MTTLLLSPLTDSEVYDRSRRADLYVAFSARDGRHVPGTYWHENWLRDLEKSRVLDAAATQRLSQPSW